MDRVGNLLTGALGKIGKKAETPAATADTNSNQQVHKSGPADGKVASPRSENAGGAPNSRLGVKRDTTSNLRSDASVSSGTGTPVPSTNSDRVPDSPNKARAGRHDSGENRRRYGPASELTLVKAILSKALAKKGILKDVERYAFVTHWEEIVGPKLAAVSKPDCLSRRAVVVKVTNSAWAQELSFMKPVILERLASFLSPGEIVDDIVFRVADLSRP